MAILRVQLCKSVIKVRHVESHGQEVSYSNLPAQEHLGTHTASQCAHSSISAKTFPIALWSNRLTIIVRITVCLFAAQMAKYSLVTRGYEHKYSFLGAQKQGMCCW